MRNYRESSPLKSQPTPLQPSAKSAFSLSAFCSERLKEIAEKASTESQEKQIETKNSLKRLVPSDETDDEHVTSAFTSTSKTTNPNSLQPSSHLGVTIINRYIFIEHIVTGHLDAA